MNHRAVQLVVPGEPQALQRARTGQGRMYDPKPNKVAKGEIVDAWKALGEEPFDRDTPLAVAVHCFFLRPSSHYGTGRNSERLKASAPRWVTRRPDTDNLVKMALDALQGYAFHDDSRVVRMEASKMFVEFEPQMLVTIRELPVGVPQGNTDELPRLRESYARWQREHGKSHYEIAKALGLSLSEVRVLVDGKAREASERWAA